MIAKDGIARKAIWMTALGVAATASSQTAAPQVPQTLQASTAFSESDIKAVQAFWADKGRFTVLSPSAKYSKEPWQVRLTPEGSTWLAAYGSLKSSAKSQPGGTESVKAWDAWVAQKINFDRYEAGNGASEANARISGSPSQSPVPFALDPGAEPDGLVKLAGLAPPFAAAVAPSDYSAAFPDGDTVTVTDNPPMRANYPSYRFSQGVMSGGMPVKNMPADELQALFAAACITDSEERVMKAVSMLEGGFDSVNTYDTGYVSVGLIQFACLSSGSGSLGAVLQKEKQSDPASFKADFHDCGLDVTDKGALVALDLDNGRTLAGPDAARQIINDKRLIAVFQHAGQMSRAFRIAQLEVAKAQYYPSQDPVAVTVNGQTIQGKVSDFVHSEAGIATLMDRKVNTGRIEPLPAVLAQVGTENSCKCPDDFAPYELEIVQALKYRKDYTLDSTLSQPIGAKSYEPLSSRHGTIRSRGRHS